MDCRACGICCIELSISSPIPGMPNGKKAGEPCLHLKDNMLCGLFGMPTRPAACISFKASPGICGSDAEEAVKLIRFLER